MKQSATTSIYDIIVLTETNLNCDISTSELGLSNFNVFRSDRSSVTSSKSSGGGVLVAVNSSIKVAELHSDYSLTESVFLQLKRSSLSPSMLIAGLYIPPNKPADSYSNFCEVIDEFLCTGPDYDCVLLLGDFNLPHTNWTASPLLSYNNSAQLMIDLMESHNLFQINGVANVREIGRAHV